MSVNIEVEDVVYQLWSNGSPPNEDLVIKRLDELLSIKEKTLPKSFTHFRAKSSKNKKNRRNYEELRKEFIVSLRGKLRDVICKNGKIKEKYISILDNPISPPTIALLATAIFSIDASYGVDISVLAALFLVKKISTICYDEDN